MKVLGWILGLVPFGFMEGFTMGPEGGLGDTFCGLLSMLPFEIQFVCSYRAVAS